MDNTLLLAEYCSKLNYSDIPYETMNRLKLMIIDYLASVLAGKRCNVKFNRAIEDIMFSMGGKEEASVLFEDRRLPAENAAFLNAIYAHGADIDDGHKGAMGHVACHVMSAVFALAEERRLGWEMVAPAIISGYQVFCKISSAVSSQMVKRGFHTTGMAGVIASAAACGKLLGLDERGIYSAMSISVTQASGLLIVAESGQNCKGLNPANAAKNGILSAKLAKKGIEGFDDPLDSEKGWFHAACSTGNISIYINNEEFSIDKCYQKPYPSCRHTHGAIECASAIRNKYGVSPFDIEKAVIEIYENAINIAGRIKCPKDTDGCKFSIHYSAACSLISGCFTIDDVIYPRFDDMVSDMINKITLVADNTLEDKEKEIRGTRLKVYLKDGRILSHEVKVPLGDPENPMGVDLTIEKLKNCAGNIISEERQKNIVDSILSL